MSNDGDMRQKLLLNHENHIKIEHDNTDDMKTHYHSTDGKWKLCCKNWVINNAAYFQIVYLHRVGNCCTSTYTTDSMFVGRLRGVCYYLLNFSAVLMILIKTLRTTELPKINMAVIEINFHVGNKIPWHLLHKNSDFSIRFNKIRHTATFYVMMRWGMMRS
jgi:hypothetical protein